MSGRALHSCHARVKRVSRACHVRVLLALISCKSRVKSDITQAAKILARPNAQA